MGAGSIIRAGNNLINSLSPNKEAAEDLQTALSLGDKPILQLFYELALECGLDHKNACNRVIPIYFQNCAIHLADDIADGDCDYFLDPEKQGSTALYSLQQLVSYCLAQLSTEKSQEIIKDLCVVGFAQHKELKTSSWNLDVSKEMAEELNGCQFRAYFATVSADSERYESFRKFGYSFGIVNHLANDIKTSDQRFFDLEEIEQEELRSWGLSHVELLKQAGLSAIETTLPPLLRHLR